jgi:phospholipid/cholesterol/gamma-HCH transport system substrate-binding protein
MFYPGLGTEQVPEGEAIPVVNSPEARRLIAAGLAERPERDDGINNIMNLVNSVLTMLDTDVQKILVDVQDALEGTNGTSLGRTLGNVETATSGFSAMSRTLPADVIRTLNQVVAEINPILENLQEFTDKLSDPSGSIMSILESEGPLYTDLIASLDSISGILRNLEKTSEFFPSQLPAVLSELHSALQTAQDVLIALTNNPLLKGGIPAHTETYPGGARPRDLEF